MAKSTEIKKGEVWYVNFPLEEDITRFITRPVVVIDDEHDLKVLSVKVTKHEPRKNDSFDTPILYWEHAKLRCKSTARVSKIQLLNKDMFLDKLGDLHEDDLKVIEQKVMEWYESKQ